MPTESSEIKNKRIAKNTLLLYGRTFCTMIISLFTSRLTLEALGVDNFGVYNVVGGFVGLFSILSGTITGSISRFITYGLGKGDLHRLKITFSTSINVQLLLCLLIVIIGETIGLWFLNYELNIPESRMYAAHWVLQCSILTFCFGLLSAPYNACIIAHEKMGVFAYMTILDVTVKLLFVYLLFVTPFDTLITYAVALTLIGLFNRIIYGWYCVRHFEECRYKPVLDKKLLKEMSSFAGWNFFGNTAYLLNTQGVNIIINMFFGVALNAARGIVTQVEGAVLTLVNNFTMAFTPQITKSYAENNIPYFKSLIARGAKFTFFLFILIVIPLCIEAPYILHLWLKEVPPYTVTFLRLSLICNCILQFGSTGYNAIMATGKIRNYQIAVTIVGCLVFPLSWIAYHFGAVPQATYYIFIPIYVILIYIRLYYMKKLFRYSPYDFMVQAIIPSIIVIATSAPIPYLISEYMTEGFVRLLIVTIISVINTGISVYVFGLSSNEKNKIASKLFRTLHVRQPYT